MVPRIDLIAGARPNFVKIAALIDAIENANSSGDRLHFRLVHTGQHYDYEMSGKFFEQLCLPEPDVFLGVGSGTQAQQTGNIMVGYERLLEEDKSDLCVVVGDVTSTMSCAIVARKSGVPVAHIEAGIRSGDWEMPEEINRVVTDSVTNFFFTTSETANENLRRFGIDDSSIFFVGNVMIDTLLKHRLSFRRGDVWREQALSKGEYFVTTLHRPQNVDDAMKLKTTLTEIANASHGLPVIFPIHPRSKKNLEAIDSGLDNICFVDPQGYLEFNYLVSHAKGVITDSGGVTEEATALGVPCMTLRDSTERPETVSIGTNELIGSDPKNIAAAVLRVMKGQWKKGGSPKKWDGNSATRVIDQLREILYRTQN